MLLKTILGLATGWLSIAIGYFWSLRRSPYWRIFKLIAGFSALGVTAAVLGAAADIHVAIAGIMAIALAVCAPIILCVLFLEIDVSSGNTESKKWRRAESARKAASTPPPPQHWEVESVVNKEDEKVKVRIRKGEFVRTVGSVDPVADIDGYQTLRHQADEQMGIYESLDIVSESKALEVYDANQQRWVR